MAKSQISFEFIVVFAFVLFAFMVIINFFPIGLKSGNSTEGLAQKLAKEIKVKAITASLAKSDFEGNVSLPKRINNADIQLDVYKDPDNLIHIREKAKPGLLAKAFLPKTDSYSVLNPDGATLTIRKDYSTNTLSMIRQ